MENSYRKVKRYLQILAENIYSGRRKIEEVSVCPSGYKTDNTPPALSEFKPYVPGSEWGNGRLLF